MEGLKAINSGSPFPSSRLPTVNSATAFDKVVTVLRGGVSFLLATHRDPDFDGIGSMLALAKALIEVEKDVVLVTEVPVSAPYNRLKGAERIVQRVSAERRFDAVVVFDCSEMERLGALHHDLQRHELLINIDHHETNTFFGDLNLVDLNCSSTGELVFYVIKQAGFSIDLEVAENIFATIQADTGEFRYDNTTSTSLRIAAEMMDCGVNPWELSRRVMDGYGLSRLRLLEMALSTIEFHHEGKIGMMTLFLEMFRKAGATLADSERFVDYPRLVSGVELAVLIRQTGENDYKFSLRSNSRVNVAQLAACFGGGGHANAAGLECQGSLGTLKKDFLEEAVRFLDGAGI
jgi:phosphoesterase RecJ-like protein